MSNQRLLAGLSVVAAIVAIIVIRSGDSEPATPHAVVTGEADERLDTKPSAKSGKGKHKSKHVRKVKERLVAPGPSRLSCPDCNVILISLDALRADHMGTYGYQRPTSPALDKFAKQSVLFERAISQSSWTSPAIASMLTGQLPREHGMLYHPSPGSLSPKTETLASRLGKAGYRTASWNGGGYVTKSMGKGFDVWKSSGRTIGGNLESARDWLGKHGQERFFMFLHGYDLQKPYLHSEHNTFHQPQGKYDMLTYCKGGKQRVLAGDELEYVKAQYDAGIVAVDQEVGKFLNFLRDKRLLNNSVVVITSAHGEELFEHGGCDHKQSVYEELVHVPLIIRLPSKVKKRVKGAVAASISLAPTILGLLGLDEGKGSALDLRNVANKTGTQPPVVSETGATESADGDGAAPKQPVLEYYRASVTAPDYKLVFNHTQGKDSWELYDVTAKPAEQENLATRDPARVATLRKVLFPPRGVPALPALPTSPALPAPQKKPDGTH